MLKTRKRWVALLTAVCMIAAFCVPFVGTASASSATYSTSYTPAVSAGVLTSFTSPNLYLTVTMNNSDALNLAGSQMVMELPSSPSGYSMTLGTSIYDETGVFAGASFAPVINGNVSGEITITVPSTFVANSVYAQSTTVSSFAIQIVSLFVPGGVNGNVPLTVTSPNGSEFTPGSLTLATTGSGSVTVAAESVLPISSGTSISPVIIDITESMAGALNNSGGDALKLTLPPGITWSSAEWDPNTTLPNGLVWGAWGISGAPLVGPSAITNAGRELDISRVVPTNPADTTDTAVFAKLEAFLSVDQSTAKQGTVVVNVGGTSTYSPSTLTVATYGTYAVSDKVLNTPTITAGLAGSTIGEFEVVEGLPGSLINGRTIDLTLPSNVAWSEVPTIDSSASTLDNIQTVDWLAVGSSGNEIEGTLIFQSSGGVQEETTQSESTPAVIAFKNAEVTPAVDFTPGPLNVTVGGTEGLSGTFAVATVGAGVTAAASASPDVTIGTASASVGDLTITEAAAGNLQSIAEYSGLNTVGNSLGNSAGAISESSLLSDDAYFVATNSNGGTADIDVVAPSGVTFFNTPTVTVTAGDLQLGTISTATGSTNNGEIVIPIKSTSTTPSTISITGAQVTIDRTVPEGPITFKVEAPVSMKLSLKVPEASEWAQSVMLPVA